MMQLNRMSEKQLRSMMDLKGSEVESILLGELRDSQALGSMAKDEHVVRWHQGRQQLLFEILEVIDKAREALNKTPTKPASNAF